MRSSDLVVSLNDERFCDTTAYARPWAKDFRIGATLPIRWGVTMGLTFKNNAEGALTTTYAIVPGTGATATRYPDGAVGSTRKVAGNQHRPVRHWTSTTCSTSTRFSTIRR